MIHQRLWIMLIVGSLLAMSSSVVATNGMYIRKVTPQSGRPGTVITIRGNGFGATAGTRLVSLNLCRAYPMPVLRWSNTLIRARVPKGLFNGVYKVLIYYDRSYRTSSNSIDFRVTGAPRYVTTRYEGRVGYEIIYYEPSCWWKRLDGVVDRNVDAYFPEVDRITPDVDRLIAAIGCPTTRPTNDREMWIRTVKVWEWLQANELKPNDANYSNAENFYGSLGRWPSLADIAAMYSRYGGIYWGTCMSRAQLYATLLYAIGLPSDRLAIAETRTARGPGAGGYQHMYVILYIKGHWIYLDPSCINLDLPDFELISSVGCVRSADYSHPCKVKILPGSQLSGVPLVERGPIRK